MIECSGGRLGRRRPRAAAATLVLLLALVACARHELPPGAVRTVVERSHKGKRVLLVGLDGADWKLLDAFVADGTMPHLRDLIAGGERRTLLTQHPPLSPLVWTSMMTGVSPLEHRILDFARFNPVTREKEPITSDERAVPAIWNMATYGGKRAGVFAMWATYPAEPEIILTDRDVPHEPREQTELVHRRASEWLRANKPDLAIVYFEGTDAIGHLAHGDIEAARGYFKRIDEILGDYRALAESLDAELVIASDHGFDWGGKHDQSSTAVATAAKWHREEGIFLRWPSDSRNGASIHAADLGSILRDDLGLPADLDYRRYFHRVAAQNTKADTEAIANLKALGYIGSSEPSRAPASSTSTRTPASFNNEGLILREANKPDDAQHAFESAIALNPNYAAAMWNLSDLLEPRDPARSDALLLNAYRLGHPEALSHILERAKRRRDTSLLGRAIAVRDDDALRIWRGRYALEAHDCAAALADFRAMKSGGELREAGIQAASGCLGAP